MTNDFGVSDPSTPKPQKQRQRLIWNGNDHRGE
jgi:hypothetical protein